MANANLGTHQKAKVKDSISKLGYEKYQISAHEFA